MAQPDFERPSIEQLDPRVWEAFLAVPNHPALVSFPRTGSHWLRMLLELMCERPGLKRAFFYLESDDYLLWHTHDHELDFCRARVIYLHRDPVDTVFSQLQYEGRDWQDPRHVLDCCNLYLAHLRKWLVDEAFTQEKLIVKYSDLKLYPERTLQEVVAFLGQPWHPARFASAQALVTKELVRLKTHKADEMVISTKGDYAETRTRFRELHAAAIHHQVVSLKPGLSGVFD